MTYETESTSLEATETLGDRLGRNLKGGEVIELISDLGGGKTSFTRGLARGAGSTDQVSSPSFTLTNEYQAGQLTLHHFDFYRLSEPGIMRDELAEVLSNPMAVVIVEWAGIVEDVLPSERLTIHITATGETTRTWRMDYPATYDYLLAGTRAA